MKSSLPAYSEPEAKKANVRPAARSGLTGKHSAGFSSFTLKPQLNTAIQQCGFQHPSEVQQQGIPQAMLGSDIICQALSGMGKTAVFVISVLQKLESPPQNGQVLVLAHSRQLAYQIKTEFDRFSKHLEGVTTEVFIGGFPLNKQMKLLRKQTPTIIVGTPGRILALGNAKVLNLQEIKHFIMDECDKLLETVDMRSDVQHIFRMTKHDKQVMLFSATMSQEIRNVFRKFTQNQVEIFIDDERKLTLHGLQQYYLNIEQGQKTRKLIDLLDALQFNQVIIFVRSPPRAIELNKILVQSKFPSTTIHSNLRQAERQRLGRVNRYKGFKDFNKRIMISTDLFGRGVDMERVNIVFNYDMPRNSVNGEVKEQAGSNAYLHRVGVKQVGRAGRFGTKGLAVSFVSSPEDQMVLDEVQARFDVGIKVLPDSINISSYSIVYLVSTQQDKVL